MKAFSSKKITFDISNKVDQCAVQKLNPSLCITHKIMQLEQNFQICSCVVQNSRNSLVDWRIQEHFLEVLWENEKVNDFSKDLCHYEQVHSKCDISIYNWAISTDYKIKLVWLNELPTAPSH